MCVCVCQRTRLPTIAGYTSTTAVFRTALSGSVRIAAMKHMRHKDLFRSTGVPYIYTLKTLKKKGCIFRRGLDFVMRSTNSRSRFIIMFIQFRMICVDILKLIVECLKTFRECCRNCVELLKEFIGCLKEFRRWS